jgi:hypothetical protein
MVKKMNKQDKIRMLMSSSVNCMECPAAKYCKNTNMSCDDTRLQYVCQLQRKTVGGFYSEDELEREEMLIAEANEMNYMWNKKEERRREELYKDEDNRN